MKIMKKLVNNWLEEQQFQITVKKKENIKLLKFARKKMKNLIFT